MDSMTGLTSSEHQIGLASRESLVQLNYESYDEPTPMRLRELQREQDLI